MRIQVTKMMRFVYQSVPHLEERGGSVEPGDQAHRGAGVELGGPDHGALVPALLRTVLVNPNISLTSPVSRLADLDPIPDPYVLGLLDSDPDPLVRGMDPDTAPDPSINKQK